MAMIQLDIGTPAQTGRVIDALCLAGGYRAGEDGPKPQFAKKVVADFIRATVRNVEISQRPVVEPVEPPAVAVL